MFIDLLLLLFIRRDFSFIMARAHDQIIDFCVQTKKVNNINHSDTFRDHLHIKPIKADL